MSSSQDWSDVNRRPMKWIYGTFCVLFSVGFLIGLSVAPFSPDGRLWAKAGAFLMALALFVILTIPGTLVAIRHPWGAYFRVLAERHYTHPRLVGLAQVWAGLVVMGGMSVLLFLLDLDLVSAPLYLPVAGFLIALAPLLALALFDRR